MKHYVIICETMNRAGQLCSRTANALGSLMRYVKKHPMLTIETKDDVCLHFTSEDYWFRRGGRLGRHYWVMLRERYFEEMLDEWERTKHE